MTTIMNSEPARATGWTGALVAGGIYILNELSQTGDPDWRQILIGAGLIVLIGGGAELTRSKVWSADSHHEAMWETSLEFGDPEGPDEVEREPESAMARALATLSLPRDSYVLLEANGELRARSLELGLELEFDGDGWVEVEG